jgi:hypothetical protein
MVDIGETVPGAIEVQTLSWIETRAVANRTLVEELQKELDLGESEAIALAIEINADRLLIDESPGRSVASRLGLNFTGVLGVLLSAKHQGLISSVKPIMDDLRIQAGFRVSDRVYSDVLKVANESLNRGE